MLFIRISLLMHIEGYVFYTIFNYVSLPVKELFRFMFRSEEKPATALSELLNLC